MTHIHSIQMGGREETLSFPGEEDTFYPPKKVLHSAGDNGHP